MTAGIENRAYPETIAVLYNDKGYRGMYDPKDMHWARCSVDTPLIHVHKQMA